MSANVVDQSILDKALWLAGFICQVTLSLVLLLRRRLTGFPVFIGYIALQASTTALLFTISKFDTDRAYTWAYWILGFSADPITCWLIIDIIRDAFCIHGVWRPNIRKHLLGWGALIVLTSAAMSVGLDPPGVRGFDLWESRASLFTALFICAMFAVLSCFSISYGLGRRHAVALGQGLFLNYYSVLLKDLVHSIVSWKHHTIIADYACEFVYLAVLIYWIVVFWNSEKDRPPLSPALLAYMTALHEEVKTNIRTFEEHHQ